MQSIREKGRGPLLSHLCWLARLPHVGPGFSSALLDRSVRRGCFFPVVFLLGVVSSGTGRRPGDSLIFDLWPSTATFWLSLALALSLLGLQETSVFWDEKLLIQQLLLLLFFYLFTKQTCQRGHLSKLLESNSSFNLRQSPQNTEHHNTTQPTVRRSCWFCQGATVHCSCCTFIQLCSRTNK